MQGQGYKWFEERFPNQLSGTVVFVTRTDSNIYPVFIDYVVGPISPVIQSLNDASDLIPHGEDA